MHVAVTAIMTLLFGLAGLAAGLGAGSLVRERARRSGEALGSWNMASISMVVLLAIVGFARGVDGAMMIGLGVGAVVGLALHLLPD